MSKLIKYPEFSLLPPFTDAANVIENIRNWINKGMVKSLEYYCRPDNSEIGYRFVTEEDLLETIVEEQTILRRQVKITFIRYAERKDISFCPLYFSTCKITVEIQYNGKIHHYKNDNQLKIFLKNN
jgi:phage-related protein